MDLGRQRTFLLALLLVFGVLSALLVLPYLQYVLAALLLGYALHPLHRRLEPRVGSRVAAGVLIAATVFAVLFPIAILAQVALSGARSVFETITAYLEQGELVRWLEEMGVQVPDLVEMIGNGGSLPVGGLVGVLGGLTNAAVGLTVLVFVLYYLLTTGDALMAWLRRVTPLTPAVQDELYARVDRLTWAALVVNVVVAGVQGVLTGIGLWAVGFPNPAFWTVMTTLLALLPLIGASVVWAPAAVYLLFVSDPLHGVALAAYGALVVSLSDNYLRPVLGGHEARLNPGLFVLGIFGGTAALGFVGIFYGPIVLGALKALVEVYTREEFPEGAAEAETEIIGPTLPEQVGEGTETPE
ncbi:AI-2E family transporter [Halobium salinum]|uniref:AI-2E family transporter n=1 Tax=Halobium salinum TaxID=1364940 RepID=A0ABD5P9D6_9EURY|nr:AI-2E family transporter [Halobium salinum]